MNQHAEIVQPGFSVADAESITFRQQGRELVLEFVDWRERPVVVAFENTVGFRHQMADYTLCEGERFDSTHVIHGSEWLRVHRDQNQLWGDQPWIHYKLNFNAGGVVEVLCTGHRVESRLAC